MKKIVAQVVPLQPDFLYSSLYCVGEDGNVDSAVTSTLCDVVWELRGPPLEELLELLDSVASGKHAPPHPDLPDLTINGKCVWLHAPHAEPGHALISNGYLDALPGDAGWPRTFTYAQIRIAAQAATDFQCALTAHGQQHLVGRRVEVNLPG